MTRRRRVVITQRQQLMRAAQEVRVGADDMNRAKILGQIAYHLSLHREIGRKVAYKGGAVLKMIEGSPRFSRDLDGVAVTAKPIQLDWILEALTTEAARRVVIQRPTIINSSDRSLSFPVVECRAIAGRSPITVKLSINWREPLLLPPELLQVEVFGVGDAELPIVHRRERVAEKVRAFLERADSNDAFDLHFFAGILRQPDWAALPGLVRRKLELAGHNMEGNFREEFEATVEVARAGWPGELIIGGGPPTWETVEPGVRRFSVTLP